MDAADDAHASPPNATASVAELCAAVHARHAAAVAAWFQLSPAEVAPFLAGLSVAQRMHLDHLFVQASRLAHAAERAAPPAPPVLAVPFQHVEAHLEANAALLVAEADALAAWQEAEAGAADAVGW